MRRLVTVSVQVLIGLGLLAVAVAVAGCGSDDGDVVETGSQPSSTTTIEPSTSTTTTIVNEEVPVGGEISLTVQVVSEGVPLRDATLTCDEGRVEGTGYLGDPAAAQAACDLLTASPSAANRLVNGREAGLMCTQQYGGPEVAKVTGTIGERRIDVKIDRTDGCGIAEWNLLTPLLGSPAT